MGKKNETCYKAQFYLDGVETFLNIRLDARKVLHLKILCAFIRWFACNIISINMCIAHKIAFQEFFHWQSFSKIGLKYLLYKEDVVS